MSYQPNPVTEEGSTQKVLVDDPHTQNILEQMLIELKKIQYHLSVATDDDLSGEEIGD